MLKDDVVSKEVSEEMQEKGIELEAYYSWVRTSFDRVNAWTEWKLEMSFGNNLKNLRTVQLIPTYTLDQMLRELPEYIEDEYRTVYNRKLLPGIILYESANDEILLKSRGNMAHSSVKKGSNYATACAKLLLWCKENGCLNCTDETQKQ